MTTIKRTRSELIKTRKRIKIAKKGHELLKKKQDSLIMEFFKLLKEVKGKRNELQNEYEIALQKMNQARALTSDLHIKATALSVKEEVPLELNVKNIAGVKVPEITTTRKGKEFVFDSLMIQDVSIHYVKLVDIIIDLAAKETALKKILEEIKKTKRRSNALEKIMIPRLQDTVNKIQLELEERAREEFVRLKKMKT